jgi:hypothetical protein
MNVTNNEHDYTEKWPIFVPFLLGESNSTIIGETKKPREGEVQTMFLSEDDEQVDLFLGPGTEDAWLLANLNRNGYYVVNYDEENWRRLVSPSMIA